MPKRKLKKILYKKLALLIQDIESQGYDVEYKNYRLECAKALSEIINRL